jgi:diguanylate cyclase (GGDEF)-like protein
MQSGLRESDVVARLGGDEFAVLLPETGDGAIQPTLERMRHTLLRAMNARGWPVTVSIGAAVFDNPPGDVDEVIRIVDHVMYRAKASGKNRITTVYSTESVETP